MMLNMLWTAEYDAEWEAEFSKYFCVKRAGFNVHNILKHWMTEDEVIEALKGIDVFLVGYDPVSEYVLKNAPDLKLILSVRDGPEENINLSACEEAGIPVLNSAGRCTHSVAELTFNLIMNMARPVIHISSKIRKEKWTAENTQALRNIVEAESFELYRKTLGIIGLGRNGRCLAEMGKACGMQVVAFDPFLSEEAAKQIDVELLELNDLMAVSDYISILARVTPENYNLVGKDQIALMKPTAALVNTGRPQLLDLDALAEALKNDRIRYAAIDVYKPEPIGTDSLLYEIPANKLIITNHMAGYSNERTWHQYNISMENLIAFLKGEKVQNNCTRNVESAEMYAAKGGALYGSMK